MPPASMRAAVVRGRRIGVESVPIPKPAPGEARVRLLACGVCGSDLHLFGAGLYAPDCVPGHEMTGEVDALGDGSHGPAPGTRVAIEPLRSCGRCATCLRGLDALCREGQVHGIHRDGGFAEFVTLPVERLFPLPSDLEPAVAALTEPMAVCVRGLRRGGLATGERVLVLGAGSIGLLSVAAARALGAGDVWLTARHAHQAELGAALGATRVLREEEADLAGLDALGRETPIDLVIETVGGGADTLLAAGAAVRPAGRVSILGLFLGRVEIDALSLFLKEATVAFSNCYAHPRDDEPDFAVAAALVAEQRDALAAINTHTIPLDDIERAYAVAADKKAGAVKVTVVP